MGKSQTKSKKSKRRKSPRKTAAKNTGTAATPKPEGISQRDELVRINGIDPQLDLALNSVGVRQFRDFQNYSPESLASVLNEQTGVAVDASRIEEQDWFGQARRFTQNVAPRASAPPPETNRKPDSRPAARKSRQQTSGKSSEQSPEPARPETTASKGKAEAQPTPKASGSAAEKVPPAAGQRPHPQASEPKGEPSHGQERRRAPAVPNGLEITIKDVRFDSFERPDPPDWHDKKYLECHVTCNLSLRSSEALVVENAALCVQVLAEDTLTGAVEVLVSESAPAVEPGHDEAFRLEFEVPAVGHYQLFVLAFLLPAPTVMAIQKGPALHVLASA